MEKNPQGNKSKQSRLLAARHNSFLLARVAPCSSGCTMNQDEKWRSQHFLKVSSESKLVRPNTLVVCGPADVPPPCFASSLLGQAERAGTPNSTSVIRLVGARGWHEVTHTPLKQDNLCPMNYYRNSSHVQKNNHKAPPSPRTDTIQLNEGLNHPRLRTTQTELKNGEQKHKLKLERAADGRVPQNNAWSQYWHQIDRTFINRKIFWILFFHVIIKYTITIMSHIPIWFYVFCFFLLSFLQSVQREGRIQYLTGYFLQNNNLYYVLVKICTFFKH